LDLHPKTQMGRSDAIGLFWADTPRVKRVKAEKIKRTPPEPVWLQPDYLPGLEEALRFPVHVMSTSKLLDAASRREELITDVECYENYFLVCFTSRQTGHVFFIEAWKGGPEFNAPLLHWILTNFTTVGFNSLEFDIPICSLAVAGLSLRQLKSATNLIILGGQRGWKVLKTFRVEPLKIDHIDLIEVAPLRASLKSYAGRLHVKKMQDLPFHPDTVLTSEQMAIVRWYCVNDITNTAALRECLKEHIDLRYTLSKEYKVDVRSKSDAQIAEAVISAELKRKGMLPRKPQIAIGTLYRYKVPHFIKYQTQLLNWMLDTVRSANFVVDEWGSIALPEHIKNLKLEINGCVYRMGIGGLHSSEQKVAHHSDKQYIIVDKDVTSYYPFIILNLGLTPQHLGQPFLQVYRSIVERRILAKKQGNKVVADSLKIVVNGSFGKLGSKHSILYSPDLLIQVTMTGQLLLLMLIERLELNGIHVVSANTDGVVIKCPRDQRELLDRVTRQWEMDTGFETEETTYRSIYSRDVNNYIAVKEDGSVKSKGAYSNPWASTKNLAERLFKNPTSTICVEAVQEYLTKQTPLDDTIRACQDIGKFVVVRSVKGGAVKIWPDDSIEYVGKSVRWYYARDLGGEIIYATTGNKVPRSDGAKPLMELPESWPEDIDYEWYAAEAYRILEDIGAVEPRPKKSRKQPAQESNQ
jgi:hypothetical protein